METKPLGEHSGSWRASAARYVLSVVLISLFIGFVFSVLPHLIGFYRGHHGEVDKEHCDCTCWDGKMKGVYGRGGQSEYKFFYINIEQTTFVIFLILLCFFTLAQRALDYLMRLMWEGRMQWTVLPVIAVACVQSNWYSAWAHVNYFNDNFHRLHPHQTYFTLTELLVTVCLFLYADKRCREQSALVRSKWPAWVILHITSTHILQSLKDQGVANMLLGSAQFEFLKGRDLIFFMGDVAALAFAVYELRAMAFLMMWLRKPKDERGVISVGSGGTLFTDAPTYEQLRQFKRRLCGSILITLASVFLLSNVTFGG